MADPDPIPQTRTELLAGAGLGLLVGLLLGLSVAELVGKLVAALIGVIGAFLGLSGTPASERSIRIGAFGIACTVGVLLGLGIRSQNLLSPSITAEVQSWTRAGATQAQAVDLVAFERLGVRPIGREVGDLPKPGSQSSALFKFANTICNEIDGMSPASRLATLRAKGSPLLEIANAAAASADPARTIDQLLQCGH